MTMMTDTHRTYHRGRQAGFHPIVWIKQAIAVRNQRVQLQNLDEHLLRDIGIDRKFADHEAGRPFWDLPR